MLVIVVLVITQVLHGTMCEDGCFYVFSQMEWKVLWCHKTVAMCCVFLMRLYYINHKD